MRKHYKLLLFFGLISLFADITYEGARGVIPSYLAFLGATATFVGLVLGSAELIGYISRFPFGSLADRTRRYWSIAGIGYFINLVSVPLLALANRLELAVVLIFLERLGKGVRSPARDVLLSNLSTKIPVGRVFGIHEMLDQVGAIAGPFIAIVVLYMEGIYRSLFLILGIPALTSLIILATAYLSYDIPIENGKETRERTDNSIKRAVFFAIGIALGLIALIPYSIILYGSEKSGLYVGWIVPTIYLLIMGVDGLVSPLLGELYAKFGPKMNLILPINAIVSTYAFSLQTRESIIVCAIFAGVAIATIETTAKSTISQISKVEARGTSFGIYYTSIGLASIIAGGLYGYLYDVEMITMSPLVSTVSGLISVVFLYRINTK